MRPLPIQLELRPRTWGGKRFGAGRKPSGRKVGVAHRTRPAHEARHPLHVTLRASHGLPSLRTDPLFPAIQRALAQASRRGLRVLHFSVQRDHLHLLVEALDAGALSRGLQGLAIRIAKALNRVLGRCGRVWADRFHARALRTPREVRNALMGETSARRPRDRSTVVCRVVRRLGDSDRVYEGNIGGGCATDMACSDWLAAARSDSSRRTPGAGTWTSETMSKLRKLRALIGAMP